MSRRLWPWARATEPALTAVQRQRLDGWLTLLDDPATINRAQQVLALPPHRWPLPPVALPAVRDDTGRELAAAVEPPSPDETPEPAPARATQLRGAYARRAARARGGQG